MAQPNPIRSTNLPGVAIGDVANTESGHASTPFKVLPPSDNEWEIGSAVAITQTAGGGPGNPFYIIPPQSPALRVDRWGNVFMGENPEGLIPQSARSGNVQVPLASVGRLFDFAYMAATRRTYSRHFYGLEVDNPSNFRLGRINANDHYPWPTTDGSQYGTPDYTQLRGVALDQPLGKLVFEGGIPKAGQPAGNAGINAVMQQESVEIYARAAEDFFTDPVTGGYYTGGELYMMTRPTGDPTLLSDDEKKPERFGISSKGCVAVMDLVTQKTALRQYGRGVLLVGAAVRQFKGRVPARGLIAENHQLGGVTNNAALPSQQIIGGMVELVDGDVISNLCACVSVAGAGTAPTLLKLALIDTTGLVLASTANVAGDAKWTTTGPKAFVVQGGTYKIPATGAYYVVILENGAFATTALQLARMNAAAGCDQALPGAARAVVSAGTGQTAITNGTTLTLADPGPGLSFWFGVS